MALRSLLLEIPKNTTPQSRTELNSISKFMQNLNGEYSTIKNVESDNEDMDIGPFSLAELFETVSPI